MKMEFEIDLSNFTEIDEEIYKKLLVNNDNYLDFSLFTVEKISFVMEIKDYEGDSTIRKNIKDAFFIIDESIEPNKYYVNKKTGIFRFEEFLADKKNDELEEQLEKELQEFETKRRKELGL